MPCGETHRQEISIMKLISLGSVSGQTKYDGPDLNYPADSAIIEA
jgi:hypothetical protein